MSLRVSVIFEKVWIWQWHLDPFEQCLQGLSFWIVLTRTLEEEVMILKIATVDERDHFRMPAGMHRAQTIEFEEKGQLFQPGHPYSLPLALGIAVVGEVIKRSLVHRHILVAVMA